ncbi:uncharacterized protein KIAA1958-like [Haliotis cracherodii]|uniref:uncharacterized protein KIAA1958-like n=1 Tax=Haliotis cracherodii TaxID=6455 RepID=UPI0039EB1F6E
MSLSTINTAFKYFLFEARKLDGTQYTADTVHGLFTALQSGLRRKDINLFEDQQFEESRTCLDALMKELSKKGLGSSARKKTETISMDVEERLWSSGSLGEDDPRQLVDTVLYLTGLHFALRGGREHRAPRLFSNPQITGPHTDDNGRKYLLSTEDASKTNHGGLKHRKLVLKHVRAYENTDNPKRCFVRLFEKYTLCKPGEHTEYFYFTPRRTRTSKDWYTANAICHYTLQVTVKRLCKTSVIEDMKTSHSLRATAATRLYQGDVDEQMICEITGHRSDAVRNYKRTSDNQKATVSDILSMSKKMNLPSREEADPKRADDQRPEDKLN